MSNGIGRVWAVNAEGGDEGRPNGVGPVYIENADQLGSKLPEPAAGDAGKVLGVLNSSGDIGWVEDQSGTLTQIQSDWDEDDSSQVSYIQNKPTLATVATSGSYADLSNKPTIPTVDQAYDAASANAQSGVAVAGAISGKQDTISDLETIRSGAEAGATAVQLSQLASVATSGSYNDLSNKPSIPAAQVQSDWNQANDQAVDYIKNKPTIPAAQVNSDWNASSGAAEILNKPTLATVATSGSYADLSNKPSIPAAQVNSDWNAASGVSQILNKPSLATVATSGSYADLSNKPTIPTVDQSYSASSTNAQSGTAVAGALATVNQVPSSTSADEDKVLTVNSSGTPVWAAAQGSSYTFSNPIKETSGTVSLDYDTDTLSASTTSWTQFDTFNSSSSGQAVFRASDGSRLVDILNYGVPNSTISLHIPGNTYFSANYDSSQSYFISLSTDSSIDRNPEHTITYIGHPLATEQITVSGTTRTAVAEQDVVINFADLSDTSLWTEKQFNFTGYVYLALVMDYTDTTSIANYPLTSADDSANVPVKYKATVAAPLTIKNPVPSITGNAGKVLAVNSGATGVEWINNVPIEVVAAMPANPTSGVLYIVTGS